MRVSLRFLVKTSLYSVGLNFAIPVAYPCLGRGLYASAIYVKGVGLRVRPLGGVTRVDMSEADVACLRALRASPKP